MFGSKPKRKIVQLINFEMNEWISIKIEMKNFFSFIWCYKRWDGKEIIFLSYFNHNSTIIVNHDPK